MFNFFKKDPVKKLEREYEQLMEKARDIQRSGDLKAYARIIEESEQILARIDELRNAKK